MGSDNSDEEKRDRVLAPDDLDITNQPEVAEIDDGRYVVSSSGPAKTPDRDLLENPDWLNSGDAEETEESPPQSNDQPHHDQSTSQQPHGDQSTPSRQSPQGSQQGNQSTDRRDQPSGTNQPASNNPSADRTQQSSKRTQQSSERRSSSSDRTQRSPDRSQQSPGRNPQSPDRSQQSPDRNPQSPDRSQQSSPNQSASRTRSTDGDDPSRPESSDLAAHDQPPVEPPAAELTNENVSKFLAESLAKSSGEYGFDATINVEGQVNRGRMTSDDIGETLETLLRWYACQTTDEVEPEVVLGIILAGSELAVEYPVQSAYAMVKQHGLKPDDSISDLLNAVRKEGSFTIPPSTD